MNLKGNKQIILGIGWTSLSTLVSGLTQILRLSILSRFLNKEDFGIVAILTFILGLTQVFSDLGFSASIMSERELSRRSFLSLYWLQFIVFNSLMIIVALFSPFISHYYELDNLQYLIPIVLLELFFLSLGKLYDTVLQKNMLFKVIAIRNIIAAFISLIIGVLLAYFGYGVLSLIFSTLSQAAIVNIWNLIQGQSTYKLGFKNVSIAEAGNLVNVGLYQMGTQLVDYVASKLDILIISNYLGVGALGIYNLAKELVLKFVMVVNTVTSKVMLPVLSNCSNNYVQLKNTFNSFLNNLSYLNTPIVGLVFLFSPFIVQIFYGSAYEEANEIVSIMSIWSLFVVLGQPNGLLAIVLKRTDISFYYTIVRLFTMLGLLYGFARTSLFNAALTMLFTYFIMFFVNWYLLLYRLLKIKLVEYMLIFAKSWIGVILAISLVLIFRSFDFFEGKYSKLLFELIAYCTVLLLYLVIFNRKMLLSIIRKQ